MKNKIPFYLILTLIPITVYAKQVIYYFEEKVHKSDLIIVCKLVEIEHRLFAQNVAKVSVAETLKGTSSEKSVNVLYGNTLFNSARYRRIFQKDKKYILFLIKDKHHFKMIGHLQGHYDINDDDQVCYGGEKTPYDLFVNKIEAILKTQNHTEQSGGGDGKKLASFT